MMWSPLREFGDGRVDSSRARESGELETGFISTVGLRVRRPSGPVSCCDDGCDGTISLVLPPPTGWRGATRSGELVLEDVILGMGISVALLASLSVRDLVLSSAAGANWWRPPRRRGAPHAGEPATVHGGPFEWIGADGKLLTLNDLSFIV